MKRKHDRPAASAAMPAEASSSQDERIRLSALLGVFLPSLIAIPQFVMGFFLLLPFLGLALAPFDPAVRHDLLDYLLAVTVTFLVVLMIGYQLAAWWSNKASLMSKENTLILIIFALYGAASFGGLRYLVARHDPRSYTIGKELAERARVDRSVQIRQALRRTAPKIALLKHAQEVLNKDCSVGLVDTMASNWSYLFHGVNGLAKRRWFNTNPNHAPDDCSVWVFRYSGTVSQLPASMRSRSLPSDDLVIDLQKNGGEYRFWVRRGGQTNSDVGLVSGVNELPERHTTVYAAVSEAYNSPSDKQKLLGLVDWRLTWEQMNVTGLNRELAGPQGPLLMPARTFIVSTVAQYLGVPGESITPASFPAEALDIIFSLLRLVIGAVFFEGLVRGRLDLILSDDARRAPGSAERHSNL